VLVIGGGVFGLTAALALRARGDDVRLVDPGPIPHRLAESTDISKVVRADYGSDALYTGLMERALRGWRDWNGSFARGLFHECGVLFLTRDPMAPGGFEHDSFMTLVARGHRLERLPREILRARFPAWSEAYVDGYFNPGGGFAESGAVVSALARRAKDDGVAISEGVRIAGERLADDRLEQVVTDDGVTIDADLFVFAIGSWSGGVLSDLAPCFRATGHPVLHLAPADLTRFDEARFPVFGADIARTGVYGFPSIGGVVKVASHGPGRVVDPSSDAERTVTEAEEREIRAALEGAIPSLAGTPLAASRICVYGDTLDGDLWIARDPARPNRVVAAGGSGHAFKLAPILGDLIADACDGVVLPRFRWRPSPTSTRPPADAARQT
jgi:glycine/D-amino acid oxidase-like deaminating enzyme